MKRAIAAACAAAALLTGPAAPAEASTGSFLAMLEVRGLVIYNPNVALNTGWWICDQLNWATGDVVVVRLYNNTGWDVPDARTAGIWVVTAVEELCPWHDHRGRNTNQLR